MAEMRLNLQLSGIQNLIKAIGSVNSALSTLNTVLNRTALSLNAIAIGLTKTAGIIPTKMSGKSSGGRGNSGGGNNSGGNQSPQDAYSILFSVFSGANKNVGAKLFTGFLKS